MRILAKVSEAIGITMLFVGGAAMDSPSLIAPVVMAFTGIAIAFAGVAIEERYV